MKPISPLGDKTASPRRSREPVKKEATAEKRILRRSESSKRDIYSRYNTLSPYVKSTFSHDVKTMANKKYTFKQEVTSKPTSRKTSVSKDTQFLENMPSDERYYKGLVEIVKNHCKKCYTFKQEVIRYNRKYIANNED